MEEGSFKKWILEAAAIADAKDSDFFLFIRKEGIQISLQKHWHKIVSWDDLEYANVNPLTLAMTSLSKKAGVHR